MGKINGASYSLCGQRGSKGGGRAGELREWSRQCIVRRIDEGSALSVNLFVSCGSTSVSIELSETDGKALTGELHRVLRRGWAKNWIARLNDVIAVNGTWPLDQNVSASFLGSEFNERCYGVFDFVLSFAEFPSA